MANLVRQTKAYLESLETGNLAATLKLFGDGAVVNSPIYGRMKAADFYAQLFEDTSRSKIGSVEVFAAPNDARQVAVRFQYEWTLADGVPSALDCVDVIEFDPKGKIRELSIIYDTHPLRVTWRSAAR